MSLITIAKHELDALIGRAAPEESRFREDAWRRMEELGLPGRKTETWKYTSLAELDRLSWPEVPPPALPLPAGLENRVKKYRANFNILVTVDGVVRRDLSVYDADIVVEPAELTSFRGEDGFSNLALAVARPGFRVCVAPGVKVAKPLLWLRYQGGAGWASAFHRVELGDGAELRVVEWLNGGPARYLRSEFMLGRLGENAGLEWLRVQDEASDCYHFNESQFSAAASSRLRMTHVQRGALWMRSQVFVDLEGPGAEANVHGLTFARGRQHVDQRVVLRHRAGHTNSTQLFKGIFADAAKGVLNGKIYIAPDAQKVSSLQLNHNLLLSARAEANTKPELEIYADDVKANHGATVGRLDEDKIFYLRSRGVPAKEAERLLSQAFAREVYMKISDPLLREFAEADYGA